MEGSAQQGPGRWYSHRCLPIVARMTRTGLVMKCMKRQSTSTMCTHTCIYVQLQIDASHTHTGSTIQTNTHTHLTRQTNRDTNKVSTSSSTTALGQDFNSQLPARPDSTPHTQSCVQNNKQEIPKSAQLVSSAKELSASHENAITETSVVPIH